MKLFQQMLVAGAALSLIAPISSQAADINLEDMSSYSRSKKSKRFTNNFSNLRPTDWAFQSLKKLVKSNGCNVNIPNKEISRFEAASLLNTCLKDVAEVTPSERRLINEFATELATLKSRVDGLEAKFNDFEAGSFSETTTLSGSLSAAIGAVDGINDVDSTKTESVQTLYTYTMDLNTSFTGDDNLYVRLRTGAGYKSGGSFGVKTASYHPDMYSGTEDALAVDKIWYQFPIGESVTAWVGPKIENYYMYAAPVSLYKPAAQKAFKLGGNSAAFGASTATGTDFKYEADNGFSFGSNVVSKGARGASAGFLTNADTYKWDTMVAYTKDQYHLSLTMSQQHNGWNSFSYYAIADAVSLESGHDSVNKPNATAYALRTYWRPEESGTVIPQISVGLDTIAMEKNKKKFKNASSYFIGFGWEDMFNPDDRIGFAYGQPLKPTKMGEGDIVDLDPSMWELYYSYKVNDSIRVTPAIFGANDIKSDKQDDIFGALITTKFKF